VTERERLRQQVLDHLVFSFAKISETKIGCAMDLLDRYDAASASQALHNRHVMRRALGDRPLLRNFTEAEMREIDAQLWLRSGKKTHPQAGEALGETGGANADA